MIRRGKNKELEMMWKKWAVAEFEVFSRNLSGGVEENLEVWIAVL
jgi:hypothetical protein